MNIHSSRLYGVVALLCGIAMPFGFAPFPPLLALLHIPALAILFLLWQHSTPAQAFRHGFLFGIGCFGIGISWVYISFYYSGGLPLLSSLLLTISFVLIMTLYIALLGWACVRWLPVHHPLAALLLLSAAWVLVEWIRSWLLSGFPWLSLGYAQIDWPLSGFAPLFGIYGVSWVVALSAAALAWLWQQRDATAFISILMLYTVLWAGGGWLKNLDWSHPSGKPLSVVMIQGNQPEDFKWHDQHQMERLKRYLSMSREHRDADLIIWPETAIPIFYHDAYNLRLFDALAYEREHFQTDFLLGVPVQHNANGQPWPVTKEDYNHQPYFNAVTSISATPGFYYKNHLVPFGEYIPFSHLFGDLLQMFDIPMSEFSAGDFYQPNLQAAGQSIGVSICYEDAFGERVRTSLPMATLLVNVSNDSWFGDSIAPHQHLQIARMRALESGRYLLRATNTGISAVIDEKGRIADRSLQFMLSSLRAEVQPLQGETPYIRFGDWLITGILSVVVILGGWFRWRHQANND